MKLLLLLYQYLQLLIYVHLKYLSNNNATNQLVPCKHSIRMTQVNLFLVFFFLFCSLTLLFLHIYSTIDVILLQIVLPLPRLPVHLLGFITLPFMTIDRMQVSTNESDDNFILNNYTPGYRMPMFRSLINKKKTNYILSTRII